MGCCKPRSSVSPFTLFTLPVRSGSAYRNACLKGMTIVIAAYVGPDTSITKEEFLIFFMFIKIQITLKVRK